VDPRSSPADRLAAVDRMCEAMAHRGPDDSGSESLDGAALGMRRLAIFDPANGHQPMRTPDGRFTLVFNGSIINHGELRAELAGNWEFKTRCDTEALLAAYARWGEDCLRRLRGMFAFAVWDGRDRTLFVARDPLGIKPLYYRHEGSRFLFASEVRGLVAAAPGQAVVDPEAVGDYLAWFAVPAPRTIYRGIFSLRPGECARFHGDRFDIRSAWSPGSIPRPSGTRRSGAEFTKELRSRLEDTIRAHTLADVPVGAFLSGGLDSAAVAGLMTRALGGRLRTFTIGFSESGYSEAGVSEDTARHFGADHCTRILTGAEVAGEIERFVAACDQPTGDGLNTYFVSQTAKAGGATVALSGLGGDELFGGYPSFRDAPRIAGWLPVWRAAPPRVRQFIVARLRRRGTRYRKLADILACARDIQEVSAMQRRVFSEPDRRSLLGPGPLAAIAGESPFHPELAFLRADLGGCGPFEIESAWEMRTYMADVLLRDSDVMSMRHALELRVPLVDRPLIEWLWTQDSADKSTPRHPKDALAAAVADILPAGLRHRRKHGFALPMDVWMRGELKPFLDETFSDSSVGRSGLFDRVAVQGCWQAFVGQGDRRAWSRAWSLAMLIAFINRRPAPSAAPPKIGIEIAGAAAEAAHGSRAPAAAPKRHRAPAEAPPARIPARTIFITSELFSSVGGIQRISQLYLKALCELDAETGRGVRLISLNDPVLDSGDIRRCSPGGLDDWVVCNRRKGRFVREALRMSRGCGRLVCGHAALLPAAWLARRLNPGLEYYLVAHGIEVWRPFSFAERLGLGGAKRIFCVSEFTRRELLRRHPLPPGRAVVLSNALDPRIEIAPGSPFSDCPPVILSVSRLSSEDRYKGLDHLIAAMPAVREAEPRACLRIAGHGDDSRRLQAIALKSGLLNGAVKFLGFLDDKALAAEMNACRLFALPSRDEGFGLVFLEAMARGRPCLGANAGGTPEVIAGDTGVLVEYGDVPGIARGCIGALRRDWDQDAILERARRFSYPKFKQRLALLLSGEP
jgi:asparagine synthase (glutamine-hydrolysing)